MATREVNVEYWVHASVTVHGAFPLTGVLSWAKPAAFLRAHHTDVVGIVWMALKLRQKRFGGESAGISAYFIWTDMTALESSIAGLQTPA